MNSALTALQPPPASPLLAGYHAPAGLWDEMLAADGAVRPAWRPLTHSLADIDRGTLEGRWDRPAASSAKTASRTMFTEIRRGSRDRGSWTPFRSSYRRLSGTMFLPAWPSGDAESDFADLYAAALGGAAAAGTLMNPGFLRSCHGWTVPRGRYLYLYAGHLARDQAGQWLVLADKARGPTGAGYAIENRIVISRMLPDVFRDCQVQRLAAFFKSMRETLQELAPSRGPPRIVLLSPGPTSPTRLGS
jgi:uncharacterized circularly permuted ATP-grasp superfamily protein